MINVKCPFKESMDAIGLLAVDVERVCVSNVSQIR